MPDIPYTAMTIEGLRDELKWWSSKVEEGSGWSSVYFAAKQCQKICRELQSRGIEVENPHPITIGTSDPTGAK